MSSRNNLTKLELNLAEEAWVVVENAKKKTIFEKKQARRVEEAESHAALLSQKAKRKTDCVNKETPQEYRQRHKENKIRFEVWKARKVAREEHKARGEEKIAMAKREGKKVHLVFDYNVV